MHVELELNEVVTVSYCDALANLCPDFTCLIHLVGWSHNEYLCKVH